MDEILFISDCHLGGDDTESARLLKQFLDQRATAARTLYILGDLFEVWLGDDDSAEAHRSVLQALQAYASQHEVFLVVGNRDFLIGPGFAAAHNINLLQEPVVLTLGKQNIVLIHGDTLCTDDVDYQRFRSQVRDPAWQQDFLAKPLPERQAIAAALRDDSKTAMQEKSIEIMDVNERAVIDCFDQHGGDVIIHGHTHRPARHDYADGRTRFVLGDWSPGPSYLSWRSDSGFELTDFRLKGR